MTDNVDTVVKDVFAQVTRYPVGILDANAHLEDDLGIDSVKLGEIFAVLRERFQLPEHLNIPQESLVSMASISKALMQFTNGGQNGHAKVNGHPAPNGLARQVTQAPAAFAPPAPPPTGGDLIAQIQAIFAEVTRYPAELLSPDAGLEDDLGIDSVKMGEVFAVLRERFSLPEDMEVARDKIRTLADVAEALRPHVVSQSPKHDLNGNGRPAIVSEGPAPTAGAGDVAEEVRAVFAEVTRYPIDILDPTASLEEELGIDSVKLGEVLAVLRQRYSLPETLDVPREKLRTIADIVTALQPYVATPVPQREQPSARTNGHPTPVAEPPAAALYAYQNPASKPFAGKTCFISGSGRGLGKDIASYLAELGASVVVNSFHSRTKGEETAEEIRGRGGDALHLWGSMANPEHVDRVFDKIEEQFGHLDFFIGNASNGMLARLEEITVEHWEKAFRTNIVGLHQSAVRATKLMRKRGGGKIITLSSPAAHGYVDYFGCMGAVKSAVESLTRSMAIEFAPYNIQVNCVSPGPVYGELLDKWPDSQRLIRQWEGNTAYTRLCEARDVSHFIAYLLSEPVKLFTGSVLVMDGGISSQGW